MFLLCKKEQLLHCHLVANVLKLTRDGNSNFGHKIITTAKFEKQTETYFVYTTCSSSLHHPL